MTNHSAAEHHFLPWVREGYQPKNTDGLGTTVEDAGTLGVEVDVQGDDDATNVEMASVNLQLYGPGDVRGIDPKQIVRMEPEPETREFPPNYFPLVEIDRHDLPWLFSPAAADAGGRVRPWFTLVVVHKQAGVELTSDVDAPNPVLEITAPAAPAVELPDLTQSWAWAHAQVVGGPDADQSGSGAQMAWRRDELNADTEKTLARLVAPRRLEPRVDYYACVVPTFEPGRRAGLGLAPFEGDGSGTGGNDDGENGENGTTPDIEVAWDLTNPPAKIRLPVYHHWEFSTGREGDFESLVDRLTPQKLDEVGYRTLDASDPGPTELATDVQDVRLLGALQSVGLAEVSYPDDQRALLADLLDGDPPFDIVPGDTPILRPSTYGQLHAAREDVPAAPASTDEVVPWLRELNADPMNRVPAGFGTAIVRDEQEQLMASAWDQVGKIRAANRLLRNAQLARSGSAGIYRDLDALPPRDVLSLTAPVFSRILADETTAESGVRDSRLPKAALSPAFRRATRASGPLAKRIGSIDHATLLDTLNGSYEVGSDGPPDGATTTAGERDDYEFESKACQQASAQRGEVVQDRVGWAVPDREDAFDYLSELRSTCNTVVSLTAPDDPNESSEAAVAALEGMRENCKIICDGSEDDALARVSAALDGNWKDLAEAMKDCFEAFTASKGYLETYLALDANQRGGVSFEDESLLDHCETFSERFARLAVVVLFDVIPIYCDQVTYAMTGAGNGDPTAERLIAELRGICETFCDQLLPDLSTMLSNRDYEEAADLVREATRLVKMSERRLDALDATDADRDAVADTAAYCALVEFFVESLADWLADLPRDAAAEAVADACDRPPAGSQSPPLDVDRVADTVIAALDPSETIRRRVEGRLGTSLAGSDPFDPIMAAPEFQRPMYEALAEYSQDHFLPGVGEVPGDSVALLETNPAFIEAFMTGLNHEMARELRWREYPTDMRGTYFARFWDRRGTIPKKTGTELEDIEKLHEWPVSDESDAPSPLGDNHREDAGGTDVVLLVRGELLRRYPNTTVYAVRAVSDGEGGREPNVPTPAGETDLLDAEHEDVKFPQFHGQLDPDVTFLGFDLSSDEARGTTSDPDDPGWFFVFEEPPAEVRFGLDSNEKASPEDLPTAWQELAWQHLGTELVRDSAPYIAVGDSGLDGTPKETASDEGQAEWGKNSAHMAAIMWQTPVRIAIHADDMLPADDTEDDR